MGRIWQKEGGKGWKKYEEGELKKKKKVFKKWRRNLKKCAFLKKDKPFPSFSGSYGFESRDRKDTDGFSIPSTNVT